MDTLPAEAGIPGYPVDLIRIENEIHWEHSAVNRGVKRYRASVQDASVADTKPGQIAIRDTMKRLVPAIETAQLEAVDGLTTIAKGRKTQWWWYISWLEPDKLAYITLRSLFTYSTKNGADGAERRLTRVARYIGKAVQEQIEFDRWRLAADRKEREDKKAVKEGLLDHPHPNLFKVLTERAKRVDAQTFGRWKKKVEEIEKLGWTPDITLQLGTKLIELAVVNGGGWFEVITVPVMGKTERRIKLSEPARTVIEDIHSRLEVARPYYGPMICPPKPWRREID